MSDIHSQSIENPLFKSLEQMFQDKAPEWKCETAMYSDDNAVRSEWSNGASQGVVQLARLPSPEEASFHLQMFAWHIPLTPSDLEVARSGPLQITAASDAGCQVAIFG